MKKFLLALALTMASQVQAQSQQCVGWTGMYIRASIYEMKCQRNGTIADQAMNMVEFNGCSMTKTDMDNAITAHTEAFNAARGSLSIADFCKTDNALHELGFK
jgi:hypothetical protein